MDKVFIIAEAGVNHNGSLENALKLIDAAVNAGADAIKFQTYKTDRVLVSNAPKAAYQIKNTLNNEKQFDMLKKYELDAQMHIKLKEYSESINIQFLSSPFDLDSLDFLTDILQLPVIKIASGEITNAPLLLKAAISGKKIILSTGMSTLGDIEDALGVLAFGYQSKNRNPSRDAFQKAYYSEKGQILLKHNVTLLHCTTEYPAPFEEANLRAISTLKQCFGINVGFSDHTPGIELPLAAVALGSVVIEKHLTLDRNLPGPDHKASLEPDEFLRMVKGIRRVESALGNGQKKPSLSELKNKQIVRKSIIASRNIRQGETFNEENLTVKRPGYGMSPVKYWELLGTKATKPYKENELI